MDLRVYRFTIRSIFHTVLPLFLLGTAFYILYIYSIIVINLYKYNICLLVIFSWACRGKPVLFIGLRKYSNSIKKKPGQWCRANQLAHMRYVTVNPFCLILMRKRARYDWTRFPQFKIQFLLKSSGINTSVNTIGSLELTGNGLLLGMVTVQISPSWSLIS